MFLFYQKNKYKDIFSVKRVKFLSNFFRNTIKNSTKAYKSPRKQYTNNINHNKHYFKQK